MIEQVRADLHSFRRHAWRETINPFGRVLAAFLLNAPRELPRREPLAYVVAGRVLETPRDGWQPTRTRTRVSSAYNRGGAS